MATATRWQRRSEEDWEGVAREILPELRAGRTVSSLRDYFGSNDEAMRMALARIGYDPHGEPIELKRIEGSPKAVAKRVAKRRDAGEPWWKLIAETGKSYGELKALLVKYGFEDQARGRAKRP